MSQLEQLLQKNQVMISVNILGNDLKGNAERIINTDIGKHFMFTTTDGEEILLPIAYDYEIITVPLDEDDWAWVMDRLITTRELDNNVNLGSLTHYIENTLVDELYDYMDDEPIDFSKKILGVTLKEAIPNSDRRGFYTNLNKYREEFDRMSRTLVSNHINF